MDAVVANVMTGKGYHHNQVRFSVLNLTRLTRHSHTGEQGRQPSARPTVIPAEQNLP